MSRGTQAVINLSALQHNFSVVRKLAPQSRILSVVKADAYGHGLVPVAKALRDSDGFGVATLEEGLALREAGVTQPILLMEGVMKAADLQLASEKRFHIVVHQQWQLDMLLSSTQVQPLTVWLKVDTGMHRLGIPADQFQQSWQAMQASTHVERTVLMSHLACADELESPMSAAQSRAFAILNQSGQCEAASLANSAGILRGGDFHYQWLRPGLMLYGASPLQEASAASLQLKPVMQLVSRIIARTQVKAGDTVGYGGTWQAKTDADIAVVAIGYGDGYPRHIIEDAYVLVHGVQCPIVGRVSMDMITVDVSHLPEAQPDTEVELWGENLPVETVAQWAGTINYELLCQITGRVQRSYIHGNDAPINSAQMAQADTATGAG